MKANTHWCIVFASLLAMLIFSLQGCSGTSFMGGGGAKGQGTTNNGGNGGEVNNGAVGGGSAGNIGTGNTGGTAGNTVTPGATISDVPVPDDLKEKVGSLTDEQFGANTLTKNFLSETQDSFYIVTMHGKAYYYTMTGATATNINDVKIIGKKMWSFTMGGDGGARTYVTEGGLVFARSGGRMFWIDPLKTPEGALDMTPGGPNFFQIPNIPDSHRGCPVSYKIGEKRYVGLGYSIGKFAVFTQDDTPPYKPNWSSLDANYTVSVKDTGNGWGYSCYIDQNKLMYYGQYEAGSPNAFDLQAKSEVANITATAPNGSRVYVGPHGNGPYAMGGDRQGNVFDLSGGSGGTSNAEFHYTFAADAGKTAVWSSMFVGVMRILPLSCMVNGTNCDNPYTYDTKAQLGYPIGPMSALPSTGVIASEREGQEVFFLRLKDAADLSKGIEAKHLDSVDGNVYMYDDFTGATLYADNSVVAYNLKENNQFADGSALSVLILSWEAVDGQPTTWQDLELDVRCYNDGDFPPNFMPVTNMNDAGMRTFVQVGSCRNSAANKVELRVTQLNNAKTVDRIKDFKVAFFQG